MINLTVEFSVQILFPERLLMEIEIFLLFLLFKLRYHFYKKKVRCFFCQSCCLKWKITWNHSGSLETTRTACQLQFQSAADPIKVVQR